jgi:hypothetical protein
LCVEKPGSPTSFVIKARIVQCDESLGSDDPTYDDSGDVTSQHLRELADALNSFLARMVYPPGTMVVKSTSFPVPSSL